MPSSQPILYGYDASPYAAKIRQILALVGTPYKFVDQPAVLPRPDLELLDINFRRIPVLAVGHHVYCDSQRIVDEIESLAPQPLYPSEAKLALPGLKLLGDLIFRTAIYTIPKQALSQEFVKDREPVFPVIADPNFESMRPHGLGEIKALFVEVQENLLDGGGKKWVMGGSSPTLADAHVAWSVNWALMSLGVAKEAGFGEKDIPALHDWLKRFLDATSKGNESKISGEDAKKAVFDDVLHSDIGGKVDEGDSLNLSSGEQIQIYPTDAEPTHPQKGSLVILTAKEVGIKLDNGVVLHFPRIGYRIVKAAEKLI